MSKTTNDAFAKMELFTFQRAKALQTCSGDMYYFHQSNDTFLCVIADGLGSGTEANKAAKAAINAIKEAPEEDVLTLMERANTAVFSLRGAAIAVVKCDLPHARITYSGMGNIRFFALGPSDKLIYPLSTKGYLSGGPKRFKVKEYQFQYDTKFLMYSDGLVLEHVQTYLKSSLSTEKTGNLIEQTIKEKPSDDVTFILGKFPKVT
ncbi:SpoIIE family protein phosphatase [Listeria sp. PSOL-1]|uniref:SpoIIE family protein phosphatase n=1 Tax=Listeria sp. PSOL-1 TaxID=1844999 RepID=UPI0013D35B4B|nr:SpoIIE family protein phosphatase [Listeria sp. PSOL-1]